MKKVVEDFDPERVREILQRCAQQARAEDWMLSNGFADVADDESVVTLARIQAAIAARRASVAPPVGVMESVS